ncbi:MAG TPA: Smr/MutS family protein [Terriglobia bacterium]|nr:Smr/MutS family protein [Terriglobia bacterium]
MYKPFAFLGNLVREAEITLAADAAVDSKPCDVMEALPSGMPDEDLFGHAMKDVHALGWSAVPLHRRPPVEIQPQNDELEALRALEKFVRNGDIEIEQTPEYIEAAVQPHGRLYLDDLRSGRFSVQARLDLHGMNQQEARFALGEFILASLRANLSCVRVIHGRGRHSHKQQPILKDSIQRWLCSRRIGRHVIAYTSARLCDGGGGAIYVLLRR